MPEGISFVGSHERFKKVDLFFQQLIHYLAHILAFLPSEALKFTPQLSVQINGESQIGSFSIKLSLDGFGKIVFSFHAYPL